MQIICGNAYDSWCTVFQNRFQLFIGHAPFFHFVLCAFAKIAFCAVQNTKSKLTFRKIENMQLWHFVSFVAGKRNPLNSNNLSCIKWNLPNTCSKYFSIVRLYEMGFYERFRHKRKWCLTFFHVYILTQVFVRNVAAISDKVFTILTMPLIINLSTMWPTYV